MVEARVPRRRVDESFALPFQPMAEFSTCPKIGSDFTATDR